MAQTLGEYGGAIRDTVTSLWHGLSITLSYLLRRPVTVQYPDRTPMPVRDMLPPRYRGFLEVDPAICTGCQACERACPIACIAIVLEKDPQNPKQRVVTQFDIDEAKCMFCGLCVEPCPTGSIQHTREFEGSQRDIRNLVFRWAEPAFPVYKVDKNAEYYPRAPLGALVRAKMEAHPWDARGPVFLPPAPPPPPGAAAEAKPAAPVKTAPKPAAAAPAAKPAAADGQPDVKPVDPAAALAAAAAAPPAPAAVSAAVPGGDPQPSAPSEASSAAPGGAEAPPLAGGKS
jgi:NADH-quinone oxidoreductase subunit I/NAD(P)H-quinone oxidoreductase subunit I